MTPHNVTTTPPNVDAIKLLNEMLTSPPWSGHLWSRLALDAAIRTIQRGSHLTDEERLSALHSAIASSPPISSPSVPPRSPYPPPPRTAPPRTVPPRPGVPRTKSEKNP